MAGADGIGDERIDREDDVGAAEQFRLTGIAEAGATLLECSVMNSSLIESFLTISVVDAKNRVASPALLARTSTRPAAVDEVLHHVTYEVHRGAHGQGVDETQGRQGSVLAHRRRP